MLFPVLASKTYSRNLQYRASHAINTLASAVFGLIYVSIWRGIGESSAMEGYTVGSVVHYVALNQAFLWVTIFVTHGLAIERSVRTGQIAIELLRPVNLFYQLMCREWGQIAYQLLYKTMPIYLLYLFTLSLPVPSDASTWLGFIGAILSAAYISICINYLIGITSLWTTESQWLYWVHYSVSTVLSGFLLPIEWLPGWLQVVSRWTPYPYLQFIPSKIYLGLEPLTSMLGGLVWGAGFTLLCLFATAWARRQVEVQGG
jgi:ABC-2 type transport system permease protein